MPKLEYFLVCESVSTDRETNRVSLFNIIEEVQLSAAPGSGYIIAQFVAVACWNRMPADEGKDYQATLRIHSPGEESIDFPLNFQMERPRHRLTFRFQGLPAVRPGDLRFELLVNGQHTADHIVTVHAATNAGPSISESVANPPAP
jgi:hypothetical protein